MKCESKYIEQLKQNMTDPSKDNEESVEDAILKAANRLIQAKFQLDKLDDQWHVVLLEAKFVQLRVSLLEGQIRGGQGDEPVFNFFFDRHKPEVCRHKIDFPPRNEKKMVAGAKKSEAPPNSRASGVQGMEANRTPSPSVEQTDANGAPNAVFVKQ